MSISDHGQGPALVALHGLPGSVRDFRWLGAALPGDVRFIRVELPGFGDSPLDTNAATHVDARGAHLVEMLDALGIARAVILGHSMGGAVAASLAAHHPQRFGGLALLSSVGLRPHLALRRVPARAWWGGLVDAPLLGKAARALMHQGLVQTGFPRSITHAEVAQTMRIVARLDFGAVGKNTAALRVPTLAAYAEDDALIEPAITRELFNALPAGPRLWFPTGGHNIQKTQAVELAAALALFVRAHGA